MPGLRAAPTGVQVARPSSFHCCCSLNQPKWMGCKSQCTFLWLCSVCTAQSRLYMVDTCSTGVDAHFTLRLIQYSQLKSVVLPHEAVGCRVVNKMATRRGHVSRSTSNMCAVMLMRSRAAGVASGMYTIVHENVMTEQGHKTCYSVRRGHRVGVGSRPCQSRQGWWPQLGHWRASGPGCRRGAG